MPAVKRSVLFRGPKPSIQPTGAYFGTGANGGTETNHIGRHALFAHALQELRGAHLSGTFGAE